MADNMQRNEEDNNMGSNNRNGGNMGGGQNRGNIQNFNNNGPESKFERLYNVIDAFIDTVNLPVNRSRAIKYGMRALGELVSEYQDLKHHHHEHDEHTENEEREPRAPRRNGPARG
jgi:hypothetical protein